MIKPENFTPTEKQKEAACLLYEIVYYPVNVYCQIKAWAWCQLGITLRKDENLHKIIYTTGTEAEEIENARCFEEALKLCPNDPRILRLCWSYLRYTNQLRESRKMLEKSLCLRNDYNTRHHLALTLKKIVQRKRFKSQRKFSTSVSCNVEEA